MVAMPEDKGVYPVVQFQHGTSLRNTEYSTLISRIASWGFVVVAPQVSSLTSWRTFSSESGQTKTTFVNPNGQ